MINKKIIGQLKRNGYFIRLFLAYILSIISQKLIVSKVGKENNVQKQHGEKHVNRRHLSTTNNVEEWNK
jgi:hypothetical protein